MTTTHVHALTTLLLASGCTFVFDGEPAETPDAETTPRPDAPELPVTCSTDGGTGKILRGELVELDSTGDAFAPVAGAKLVQRGGAATDTTSPDGGFELCVGDDDFHTFDVDAPGAYLDPIVVLPDTLYPLHTYPLSLRTTTAAQLEAFYAQRGLHRDPTKAQVLILMAAMTWDSVELNTTHGPTYAGEDHQLTGTLTWQAGAAGRYILFPNVDAPGPNVRASLRTTGHATSIPVVPGKLTMAVIADYFCVAPPCV